MCSNRCLAGTRSLKTKLLGSRTPELDNSFKTLLESANAQTLTAATASTNKPRRGIGASEQGKPAGA